MAVLTAAGNGIGRSMAHALADAGMDVMVSGIHAEAASRVRDEVRAKGRPHGIVDSDAPANTRRLRSVEQRAAADLATPFAEYVRRRGGDAGPEVLGRGGFAVLGAGETTRPIDAALVGPIVVAAIRHNRARCMTHPDRLARTTARPGRYRLTSVSGHSWSGTLTPCPKPPRQA